MIKFLLDRPIAVFLSLGLLMFFGAISLFKIPISLLPNLEVPRIVIKINSPNSSAGYIEENVTKQVREKMLTLNKLKDINSQSLNHTALINLEFDHGTNMNLANIEVNESIDQLLNSLPKGIDRPQVLKISTSDIPIVRIQIIPEDENNIVEVSKLTERVIKKRIEQIEGVSLIDVNGKTTQQISLVPNFEALYAAGLSINDLTSAISDANKDVGEVSVRDGAYQYFVKLDKTVTNCDQVKQISFALKNGKIGFVRDFAQVNLENSTIYSKHLYNGRSGLVLTVHKQENSRMNEVVPKLKRLLKRIEIDYPEIKFYLTQDQTFILNEGISNLNQDLIYGGIFCIILLFLFLGNRVVPIIMGVSIPISLLMTFICFYLFKLTFNIISLSGLALGVGMLIDNSIIVLDSIDRFRRLGYDVKTSCIEGIREVAAPVTGNVLTTIAIYGPLIFLSGLAGQIIFDQALALTISLILSLFVAFLLNPLLYKYFVRTDVETLKKDTICYMFILKYYKRMMAFIFNRKKLFLVLAISVMPLGFFLMKLVPLSILPKVTEVETLVNIDWNDQIDLIENNRRLKEFTSIFNKNRVMWEADLGVKQFVLDQNLNGLSKIELYYKTRSEKTKLVMDRELKNFLKRKYPTASLILKSAPNAFSNLFSSNEPYFEVRFRTKHVDMDTSLNVFDALLRKLNGLEFSKGIEDADEAIINIRIDKVKLSQYNVSRSKINEEIERIFSNRGVTELKRVGDNLSVQLQDTSSNITERLAKLITSETGSAFPISYFVSYSVGVTPKLLKADKNGLYHSILFEEQSSEKIDQLKEQTMRAAISLGLDISYYGKYEEHHLMITEMYWIFFFSIILVYFILALQFENLIHPLIVMLTIPFGITGSMIVLWLSGGTLDIMAAIGFVVVLGIIVDDPSLKVETINRLIKHYSERDNLTNREKLDLALKEAGELCLKPLLMVSLTTSLALLPVLFTGGLGNELQKPLVYVIIGGLTIGTFFTLWFIPLVYWFITNNKNER